MNPQQPYYGQATGGYSQQPGYPGNQPPAGQGPPSGQPPYQQQPAYYGQQPPYQGQQPQGQYQGQPQQGQYGQQPYQAQYQQPPQGQYQNQPQYGAPPQGQPGRPPNQPYAGGAPPQGQYPPGQPPYGQPQGAPPYGQQPPPAPYGQHQAQYPPQQYPQQYGSQQWQQQPQGGPPYGAPGAPFNVPPTPASPGYDAAQRAYAARVDTNADAEALRKAMKGFGCDERALIRVLTQRKYTDPWAMAQLVQDYNARFMRNLAEDIESETRGDFETVLLALVAGPLNNDARILKKALVRAGTDEAALNDVLLCRSNADIRAIVAEYKKIRGNELAADIKEDVDDTLYRLYSMILAATRAEDAAPVIPAEIDHKTAELQRATEGTIGVNAIAVAQILASSNDAQLREFTKAYEQKYHRSLEKVIKDEFRGDMEDALLRMLLQGKDRAQADALRLGEALNKSKDRLFINRLVSLYWNPPRLQAAKVAYRQRYHVSLARHVKEFLSGDYEDIVIALVGKD